MKATSAMTKNEMHDKWPLFDFIEKKKVKPRYDCLTFQAVVETEITPKNGMVYTQRLIIACADTLDRLNEILLERENKSSH